jgi:ribosomal protein S18 acetylase RimI-like enzyme
LSPPLLGPLTDGIQPAVLDYLRRSVYRNALLIANASQLRSRCDVIAALDGPTVVGVASTYDDLPLTNLAFAADSGDIAGRLLEMLVDRNPRLQNEVVWALLPADRCEHLACHADVLGTQAECQMVIESELLRSVARPPIRALGVADTPQMDALAEAAGLAVWHSSMLTLGPSFGCFVDGTLVAMAATHFSTPDIVEIGHIATHPAHRRRGYASACTAALTRAAFALAPRVFLMVLESNRAALRTYQRLGFRSIDRLYLMRVRFR